MCHMPSSQSEGNDPPKAPHRRNPRTLTKVSLQCDRRDPTCSQCDKYQWKCPGYPPARSKKSPRRQARSQRNAGALSVFPTTSLNVAYQRCANGAIKETTSRRDQVCGPHRISEPLSQVQHRFTQESLPLVCPTSGMRKACQESDDHGWSRLLSSPTLSPVLRISPVALELIDCLSSPGSSGLSLHQVGDFVSLIPARLGVSDALDAAVQCLCAGYVTIASSTPPVHSVFYSKALSSLRKSLNDPVEALSSETLCASICLSWYEVWVVFFSMPE